MQNGLLALGAAKEPARAAVIHLALFAHRRTAAHRANSGHGEQGAALGVIGTLRRQHHAHHFRNHIAGTPHDDRIANANVFATCFVLVVQGGVGHGHAAHKHRGQFGHWGEFARAPYLHINP